jgi:hypothetical protein
MLAVDFPEQDGTRAAAVVAAARERALLPADVLPRVALEADRQVDFVAEQQPRVDTPSPDERAGAAYRADLQDARSA